MLQAEDRIHRLNQTQDCTIYYQLFKDTYMEHMFDIVHQKNTIIDKIIIREEEK
jgi:SNF2 family DNA or RNA helicase